MLKLKLQYFGYLMPKLTHWKRPWCWERLKAGGEGDDREWDGWMASLTQWTWIWVNSGSWWWTGRPGMLQSMGSQSQTRLNWLTDWQRNRNISFRGLAELMLKCPYYPKQSMDFMQSYQNTHDIVHRTRTSNSKLCMEPWKAMNSQINLKKAEQN